jgi:hypothetical protein
MHGVVAPNMTNANSRFEIGFWHPFGPHGGECPEQIIDRKCAEAERNGWTLWSFQYRRRKTLGDWYRAIVAENPVNVVVFCSTSRAAVDPLQKAANPETLCRRFSFVSANDEDLHWQAMPPAIRVPHPFRKGKTIATAFVVQKVIYPITESLGGSIEWRQVSGLWRSDRVPTRGEYLIRPGGVAFMRRSVAVLQLMHPYLAIVSSEAPE